MKGQQLEYEKSDGKIVKFNVIICDNLKNKDFFYRECRRQYESNLDVFVQFDIEFGQNRIGMMQIKFNDEQQVFLIDPYDFKSDKETEILTFFVRKILCSDNEKIFKIAHGIYSLDYDHIKSQLLCNLPKQDLIFFNRNLIDTRIYVQYLISRHKFISDFSGNDIYTLYVMQNVISLRQYKQMMQQELQLQQQKQKGFNLDIRNIQGKFLLYYAVNDVVFLYESLGLSGKTTLQTTIRDFKIISQILTIYTSLRKGSVQMDKYSYTADSIKNIFKKTEQQYPHLQQQYQNIIHLYKIHNLNDYGIIISLGEIEQTKIICELIVKPLVYIELIDKNDNQQIYNLMNNFHKFLQKNQIMVYEKVQCLKKDIVYFILMTK